MKRWSFYLIAIIILLAANVNFSQEDEQSNNQEGETTQQAEPERTLNTEIKMETIKELYQIWNLDVYSFYNITQYDTPLKRKVFEKTPEYREKFEKIKQLRKQLLQSEFSYEITNEYSGYYSDTDPVKSKYNLRTKKFELVVLIREFAPPSGSYFREPNISAMNLMPLRTLSQSNWWLYQQEFLHKHIGVLLNIPLSIVRKVDMRFTNYIVLYHHFPVSEEIALQIENGGKVKVFFRIKDLKKVIGRERDISGFRMISYYFTTHRNRIEISDENGNEIFKKQY